MLYIGLRSGWWTCCVSPWLGSWHTHTPSAGYGLLLPNDVTCDVRLQHGPHWSWDWLCFQPKLLCKQNLTIIPHLHNKLLNPRVLESQSPILSVYQTLPTHLKACDTNTRSWSLPQLCQPSLPCSWLKRLQTLLSISAT